MNIAQLFEGNTMQLLPEGRSPEGNNCSYCTKKCAILVLFNDFCLLSQEYEKISSTCIPQSLNNYQYSSSYLTSIFMNI